MRMDPQIQATGLDERPIAFHEALVDKAAGLRSRGACLAAWGWRAKWIAIALAACAATYSLGLRGRMRPETVGENPPAGPHRTTFLRKDRTMRDHRTPDRPRRNVWSPVLALTGLSWGAILSGVAALVFSFATPAGAQDAAPHLRQQCSAPHGPPTGLVGWCARADAMAAQAEANPGTMSTGPSGGDLPPVSCADVGRMGLCPWNTCWTPGACEMFGSAYALQTTCDRDRAYEEARLSCPQFGRCIDAAGLFAVDELCDAVVEADVSGAYADDRPYEVQREFIAAAGQDAATVDSVRKFLGPEWKTETARAGKADTAEVMAQRAVAHAANEVDAKWDPSAPPDKMRGSTVLRQREGLEAIAAGGPGNLWTGAGGTGCPDGQSCLSPCEICQDPPPQCPGGQFCQPPWSCEKDCGGGPPTPEVLLSMSHTASGPAPSLYLFEPFAAPRSIQALHVELSASWPASSDPSHALGRRMGVMVTLADALRWPNDVPLYFLFEDEQLKVRSASPGGSWKDQKRPLKGWHPENGGSMTASLGVTDDPEGPDKVKGWIEVAGFPRAHFDFKAEVDFGALVGVGGQPGNGKEDTSTPKGEKGDRIHWPGWRSTVTITVGASP